LEGYGEAVPEHLFLFLQLEFPWQLGPADGRYLLRASEGAEPERVVVLGTAGARVGQPASRRGLARRRRPVARVLAQATAEPATVTSARATIIDPISLSAERQARAWLDELDAEREIQAAVEVLNRVLHFHRIAAADPYVHEVSPAQALVIRAGWGEGEQVADGRWLHACELAPPAPRGPTGSRRRVREDRISALRPQERLAELLSARGSTLLCEELTLRARLDLDHERIAHAAVQLQAAYAAALGELRAEGREDLAIRLAELEQLNDGVAAQARAVLGEASPEGASDSKGAIDPKGGEGSKGGEDESAAGSLDEEVVRHGLARLEAALRARTAAGFNR
jgi:hypothetical protein